MTKSIRLVIPLLLDADGIEDLCNGFRMLEFLYHRQRRKSKRARVLSRRQPELSDEDPDWLNLCQGQ